MKKFKFIDLFAGIGGFHQALSSIGGECVFASEIDNHASNTYFQNYNIEMDRDITKTVIKDIPNFDVLAAGFPCQTFSKAGAMEGFNDKTKGTLFFNIKEILSYRVSIDRPVPYVILENVQNLTTHDKGNTWNTIWNELDKLGYIVDRKPFIISPLDLGIPHSRKRVFIPCIHRSTGLKSKDYTVKRKYNNETIFDGHYLDEKVPENYYLDEDRVTVINMWEEFLSNINTKPGFPVWSFEFIDKPLDFSSLPEWKSSIVLKNRELYKQNRAFIDKWLKKYNVRLLQSSFQKFEWQCGYEHESLSEAILQFRPSGLRAKRPNFIPALVAINHKPIINIDNRYRYLTPRECARLQSFPDSFELCSIDSQAYKQLGNSVNVEVVKHVANILLEDIL